MEQASTEQHGTVTVDTAYLYHVDMTCMYVHVNQAHTYVHQPKKSDICSTLMLRV